MQKVFRIAICDDEPVWIKEIRKAVEAYGREYKRNISIVEYHSGEEVLTAHYMGRLPAIDLLLLDIEMDKVSGLVIKDRLVYSINIKRIVFMTSHGEAMKKAFGMKVMGFLEKPVNEDELFRTLSCVEEELVLDTVITYQNGISIGAFCAQDLCYIEAQKDVTVLKYADQTHKEESVRQRLRYWNGLLPEKKFSQIHRSFIVNMDHISKVDHGEVYMDGFEEEPISIGRKFRRGFKAKYNDFIYETMERRA